MAIIPKNNFDPRERMKRQAGSPLRIREGLQSTMGPAARGQGGQQLGQGLPPQVSGGLPARGQGGQQLGQGLVKPQHTAVGSNAGRTESTLGGGSYSNGTGGWTSASPGDTTSAVGQAAMAAQRARYARLGAPNTSEENMGRTHSRYAGVGQPSPVSGMSAAGGTTPIGNIANNVESVARNVQGQAQGLQGSNPVQQGNGIATTRQALAAPANQDPGSSNTEDNAPQEQTPARDPNEWRLKEDIRNEDAAEANKRGEVWVNGRGYTSIESTAASAGIAPQQLQAYIDGAAKRGARVNYDEETGELIEINSKGDKTTINIDGIQAGEDVRKYGNNGQAPQQAQQSTAAPQFDDQELAKMEAITRATHAKQQARNIRGMMEAQAYAGQDADASAGRIGDLQAQHSLGAEAAVQVEKLQATKANFQAELMRYQSEQQRAMAERNYEHAEKMGRLAAQAQARLIKLQSDLEGAVSLSDWFAGGVQLGSTAVGTVFGSGKPPGSEK
jgi:hypothetical protein